MGHPVRHAELFGRFNTFSASLLERINVKLKVAY